MGQTTFCHAYKGGLTKNKGLLKSLASASPGRYLCHCKHEHKATHGMVAMTTVDNAQEDNAREHSLDSGALLTRVSTACELTHAGFPISHRTLASMASRGGGPTYQKFGSRPLYRWGDALAWAHGRLTSPRQSSSG